MSCNTDPIYRVFITNSHGFFDWLTLLIGGALGALIVLGVERIWIWRRQRKAKANIGAAMDFEIKINMQLAETIINMLGPVHHSIFTFSRTKRTFLLVTKSML